MTEGTEPRIDPLHDGAGNTHEGAYDGAPCGYVSVRPDGVLDEVNRTFLAWTGYRQADLAGSKRFQDLLSPGGRIYYETRFVPLLYLQGEVSEIAFDLVRADGAVLPVFVNAVLKRDVAGGSSSVRLIIFNATRRRQYERDLLLARQRAEQATAELQRVNEKLREETAERLRAEAALGQSRKLEALGRLASGMAHDFNNVLQVVSGSVQLIEERANDPDSVIRLARTIAVAAEGGIAVTSRLQAFSRQSALRAQPVDVSLLLSEVRDGLATTLPANIDVQVRAPANLPPVLADKAELETVLINLCNNAGDAMPDGGSVGLTASRHTMLDGAMPPPDLPVGAYLRICVSDTGTGMDAATLDRAFEPFFTTKPLGKGTGLGLATASGFAHQSGGALDISSTPGEGTTVTLWLPQAMDTMRPSSASRPPKASFLPSRSQHRILLVEDERLVRKILGELLLGLGYPVTSVARGSDALAHLDAGGPADLIVTDLSMPDMDGPELVSEARRGRPGLPAIILTGQTEDIEVLRGRRLLSGRYVLLSKPVTANELEHHIAALLDLPEPA